MANDINMASPMDKQHAFNPPIRFLRTIKLMRVRIEPTPVNKLTRIREEMSKEQLATSKQTYGNILSLILIPVQAKVISVLSQLWDNYHKSFVFTQFHLSLVPEE